MEGITRYLVKKLVENNIILTEESDIYIYGINLIISSGILSICIGIMGIAIGRISLALTFMIALANLRHYTGGYHANSYKKCFILSSGMFILSIGVTLLQERYHLRLSLVCCSLVSSMYIFVKGSLNSEKNPKTEEELCYRKNKARQLTIVYSLISSWILILMEEYLDIATIVICTQICTALSIWIMQYRKEESI